MVSKALVRSKNIPKLDCLFSKAKLGNRYLKSSAAATTAFMIDQSIISKTLNEFFVNIGPNMDAKIPPS